MNRYSIIAAIVITAWGSTAGAQINEKRNLSEASHQIYYAVYSPDGKLIATTGSDNNVILWNAETGIIYRTLAGLKKRPNRLVFSKDGSTIFTAGEDGLITRWDPLLLKRTSSTAGHSGAIKALAISPDGTLLASGGDDKVVRIWAVAGENIKLVYELKGHRNTINTLAFSPSGRFLASGGADRLLIRWDMQSGIKSGEVKGAHDGWIRCAGFSPDGRFIATGGDDKLIRIWNSGDLSSHQVLKGHTDWVQSLDYYRTGDYLFSGGHDHQILVWETETGKMVGQSGRLEQIVLSVDASPSRNDLISSCLLSEKLRIWAHNFGIPATTEVAAQDTSPVKTAETAPEQKPGVTDAYPAIAIFSPEPVDGKVTHDHATILIIGKAEDPDGIQTMLVNRQRVDISPSGVFQAEIDLHQGENGIDLVAVSSRGKMARSSFVILCTDERAGELEGEEQPVERGIYHALIIGVDDYLDDDLTDLDYPLADAESLYRTLVDKYTFSEDHIKFLKNPNRTDIIIAMDELSRSVSEHDNLLIFYAGHGYWDEKSGIGYWLPHDAAMGNTANWFRNSTLRDFIGSIQSKHTLLIADACFSGSIFKTRSGFAAETQGIRKLHDLPSRKAMTSGALKEVPDKSVFVKYLIRELNENEARFLPSEELFGSFKAAVLNNSPNVPQYGIIQNVGDEGGDFIFLLK